MKAKDCLGSDACLVVARPRAWSQRARRSGRTTPQPGLGSGASSWRCRRPWTGAAGVSNGTYAYAAGGYVPSMGTTLDTFYRYNPVNERWETSAAPHAGRGVECVGCRLPHDELRSMSSAKRNPNTGVVTNATNVFAADLATSTWSSAANMPAPRASMASGYNSAGGKDLPGRRLRRQRPAPSAQATAWKYNPAHEYVQFGVHRFHTQLAVPHRVSSTASSSVVGGRQRHLPVRSSISSGLTAHLNAHLEGAGEPAEPDERRLWRRCERQALDLRRRDSGWHGSELTVGLRPDAGSWASGPRLNVRPLADRGNGDRKHARRRRRAAPARPRRRRPRCSMRNPLRARTPTRPSPRTSTA